MSIIIILATVFIVLQNNAKQIINPSPAKLSQFDQFPIETDDFRIDYELKDNILTIVPKIPFNNTDAPQNFLKINWEDYNRKGKQALEWLDNNGLDKQFRDNFNVKITWWAQEFWPEGAAAPTL